MATEQVEGHVLGNRLADNAITANRVVKITSTGVDTATAATDAIIGVSKNAPGQGEAAAVQFAGTARVVSSGIIAVGAWVTATTGGKIIATTSDHAVVLGRALEAAAADGDVIEIALGVFTLSA